MPRQLVYGNGSMLLQLDRFLNIRDLFWPEPGMLNHLQGHSIRMGVWVDGTLHEMYEDHWQWDSRYLEDTLVGITRLRSERLQLWLEIREHLDPEKPWFIREIQIKNEADHERDVALYVNHDLRINESDIGDTAFYHPFSDSLVHYKSSVYILTRIAEAGEPMPQYDTGVRDPETLVGSWPHAKSGRLPMSPINQGSVDSTIGWRGKLAAGSDAQITYHLLCASDLEQACELLNHGVSLPIVDSFAESGAAVCRSSRKAFYQHSLRIIQTQCHRNGAILAANDSDILATNRATYSYVWPRDGALVMDVMDVGLGREIGARFLGFCSALPRRESPFLRHKYLPNGTVGASWHPWVNASGVREAPVQQDESSLTIWAAIRHLQRFPAADDAVDIEQELVKPLLVATLQHRREDGLPLPSYDLWEERYGIHCFTVVTTIGALQLAAEFFRERDDMLSRDCQKSADDMRTRFLELFWSDEHKTLARRIDEPGSLEWIVDSAVLSAILFDVLKPDDPRAAELVETVEAHLAVRSEIGGMARYEQDYYFRRSEQYPGNPWIMTTLWLAQAKLILARTMAEVDEASTWLDWTIERSTTTGILAEQYHPITGEELSVSPLTWSHAEYCRTYQLWQTCVQKLS